MLLQYSQSPADKTWVDIIFCIVISIKDIKMLIKLKFHFSWLYCNSHYISSYIFAESIFLAENIYFLGKYDKLSNVIEIVNT